MKTPFTKVAKAIAELGNASDGHSRLSPSGVKKWMACPGSIVLESFFPNLPNKYSDEGTACHEVAAECLKSTKSPRRADDWVNRYVVVSRKGEVPERKVLFTEEMADISQQYIDDIRVKSKGHQLWIETRVDFSDWVGVAGQSGTADAGMLLPIDGDPMRLELDVDDLKGGRTPVPVEHNPQLMTYALGFLTTLGAEYVPPAGDVFDGGFELLDGRMIEKIRLSIHQPKLHPGPIEWVCTPKQLLDFSFLLRSKAMSVVNAAEHHKVIPIAQWNDTYLNPNPNDEECAFCRAKATCPSVTGYVKDTLGVTFEEIAEGHAPVAPASSMSSKKLAAAMAATELIESWVKAVRAEVERRLLIDDDVPGFGLELGKKGHRKFADPEMAEALLRNKFRLKMEDVYDFSLKTPTQIEKLTKVQKIGVGAKLPPKLGQKQWAQLVELITQSDPQPSVKKLSVIKTPYVAPASSADAFSVVPESQDEDQLY